jgi:hypothetical protein
MTVPLIAGVDVLLQRAIRRESVEGDLNGAIDLYKKIVASARRNRSAAAMALLRLGECYEKQGNAERRKSMGVSKAPYSQTATPSAIFRT